MLLVPVCVVLMSLEGALGGGYPSIAQPLPQVQYMQPMMKGPHGPPFREGKGQHLDGPPLMSPGEAGPPGKPGPRAHRGHQEFQENQGSEYREVRPGAGRTGPQGPPRTPRPARARGPAAERETGVPRRPGAPRGPRGARAERKPGYPRRARPEGGERERRSGSAGAPRELRPPGSCRAPASRAQANQGLLGCRERSAPKGTEERQESRASLGIRGLLASRALWGPRGRGDPGQRALQGSPDPAAPKERLESEGFPGHPAPRATAGPGRSGRMGTGA
ncbi:hypothetical protein ANANG_G00001170 [Anguilla anguilla]|uniref:Uncharacterized protein n=1 Tax=Anguilla anguilla TaxID=7936 RepID=A0A9D3MXZ0_ANGAN|nr:hypothetical protein ANANG_G00001170 [Anguilla anguilla]